MIYILGIETSCDNTAIALICKNKIIYKYNINQNNMLIEYGGYIPHILAERHSLVIEKIQNKIIQNINKIQYIAVTTGPGLSLSLCIGYKFATFLSNKFNKKLFLVDHIEAHLLSYRFNNSCEFPFICLLVSGGHTLIIYVVNIEVYYLLSQTIDDAVGEVFDKIAKHLKLQPQNGQGIEKCAENGKIIEELKNIHILIKSNYTNLSFSGIKTKFINAINKNKYSKNDICYTLQSLIGNYLSKKIIEIIKQNNIYTNSIIICGGVANNNTIFNIVSKRLMNINIYTYRVCANLACDNAEMIAWLCYEYISKEINFSNSYMCTKEQIYSTLDYNQFYKTYYNK